MAIVQRMVPLAEGKRTGIKLDPATWQAVDWLAAQAGQQWQQWCAKVIADTPDGENTTARIREAAMNGILTGTILAERVELESIADQHPLLRYSSMMDDNELAEHMRTCDVWGGEDMGGFKLHAGKDEFGRPCLWLENLVKGWPSVVIPMPNEGDEP